MEKSNQDKSKSKSQPPKRRAFEIIQKSLATAGIIPTLANQSYPFNREILLVLLSLGSSLYCTTVFILYDAENFSEYTQSVYTDTLLTVIILALLILMFKVKQLFEFINSSNDIANTSE